MIPASDQVQGDAAGAEVSGDHGNIFSCVVLGMTSECEGVDDSPTAEDTYAYKMRLPYRVDDKVIEPKK